MISVFKMGNFFCLLMVIISLSGLYVFGAKIFKAHLSSGWYPTDKQTLIKDIDAFDKNAEQKYTAILDPASIKAIIVPHAGYEYSGDVAAAAYRLLQPKLGYASKNLEKLALQKNQVQKQDQQENSSQQANLTQSKNQIRRVIILAPSHFSSFIGIALPNFDTYEIPLGNLNIDTDVVQALAKNRLFQVHDHENRAYDGDMAYDGDTANAGNMVPDTHSIYAKEHAIEVQLPFVYRYIGNNGAHSVSIVPLIVGSLDTNQIREVADSLSQYIDEHTLVIVSSDFTHYGPRFDYTPFSDHQSLRVRQLDSGALQKIQHYDLNGFLSYVSRTGATICGRIPIALLLALLERKTWDDKQGADTESHLVAYKTSQDVKSSDSSNNHSADFESVSYASLVFTNQQESPLSTRDQYTEYEKQDLLKYARATLEHIYKPTIAPELLYPIMTNFNQKQGGAFVTLYTKGHELRGCIGRITSKEPIYKTVTAMTRAAALEDSRFSPVTQDELADITISISLLTEPKSIKGYSDIELGKHGIILKNGDNQAVFLPKVAIEFGWDLPTTLTELSKKAGLPADAWQQKDTHFQVFESIDFSE